MGGPKILPECQVHVIHVHHEVLGATEGTGALRSSGFLTKQHLGWVWGLYNNSLFYGLSGIDKGLGPIKLKKQFKPAPGTGQPTDFCGPGRRTVGRRPLLGLEALERKGRTEK